MTHILSSISYTLMNNTMTIMNNRGLRAQVHVHQRSLSLSSSSSKNRSNRRRTKMFSSSSSSSSMMLTTSSSTIDGRPVSIFTPNVFFLIGLLMYICVFLNVWITSFENSIVGIKKQLLLDDFKQQLEGGRSTTHRHNKNKNTRKSNIRSSSSIISSELLLEEIRTISTSMKIPEEDVHNNNGFVHERTQANKRLPPIYVAIPTVPRDQDVDYLLRVLKSLDNSKFPLQNTHVFYNGNPKIKTHKRWNQAEALYSYQGVHFLWNDAHAPPPPPPQLPHDAYNYDSSLSSSQTTLLVEELLANRRREVEKKTKEEEDEVDADAGYTSNNNEAEALIKEKWLSRIDEASKDSLSRKKWRQKECYDFLTISQYMLRNVVGYNKDIDVNVDVDDHQDDSWIIFNQDDAIWTSSIDFPTGIYEMLMDIDVNDNDASSTYYDDQQTIITRYDFYETGLVSAAFKASSLLDIVYDENLPTRELCKILPVDWMLWFLDDLYPNRFKSKRSPKVVKHIGKISSRQGIVANEPTQTMNAYHSNNKITTTTTTKNPTKTTTPTVPKKKSGGGSPSSLSSSKPLLPDYI